MNPGHPSPGLLHNRKALVLVTFFCLIETAWSWVSISKGTRQHDSLVVAPFALCLAVIAASIAYKNSLWADRVILGAIAGAFALITARAASSTLAAMLAVDVAHALMWTIAACVSLMVLALRFSASRRI
jgi:hypothetical protein